MLLVTISVCLHHLSILIGDDDVFIAHPRLLNQIFIIGVISHSMLDHIILSVVKLDRG